MRGAPLDLRMVDDDGGIIPADAGSTATGRPRSSRVADHPRGCGEHISWHRPIVDPIGSSPRMRGALPVRAAERPRDGIIPADAGSTRAPAVIMIATEDHPHGCGEHCGRHRRSWHQGGSSPRMRGALAEITLHQVGMRIIPADAGSTLAACRMNQTGRDHPRGCGEHHIKTWRVALDIGSSPRMRGARCRTRTSVPTAGIIPADAGSTLATVVLYSLSAGSSPRMRGALAV